MSSQNQSDDGYAPPASQALLEVMQHDLGLNRREHVSTNEIPNHGLRSASHRDVEWIKENMEKQRRVDTNREEGTKAWTLFKPETDENGEGLEDIGGGGIARINRRLREAQEAQAQQGDFSNSGGRGGGSISHPGARRSKSTTRGSSSAASHVSKSTTRFPPQQPPQAPPPGVLPRHLKDASLPFVKTERTPFIPLSELQPPTNAPLGRPGNSPAHMSSHRPPQRVQNQKVQTQHASHAGVGRPLAERITYPANSPLLATSMAGFHRQGARPITTSKNVVAQKTTSKWAVSESDNVPQPAPAVKPSMPALTVQTSRPPVASAASRLAAMSPPETPRNASLPVGRQPSPSISRVGKPNTVTSTSLARSSSIASTEPRAGAARSSRSTPLRHAALADPSTWLKTRDTKLGPATTATDNEEVATADPTASTTTPDTSLMNGTGSASGGPGIPANNVHDDVEDGELVENMSRLSVARDNSVHNNNVQDAARVRQTYNATELINHRQSNGVFQESVKAPTTANRPVTNAPLQSKSRTLSSTRPTMDPRARGMILEGITQKVQSPKPAEVDLIDLEGFDVPQETQAARSTVPTELQDLLFPAVQHIASFPTLQPVISRSAMQPQAQEAPPPAPKPQEFLFGAANTGMKASKWAT